MPDDEVFLAELRDLVKTFVHERDWDQFHTPKDLAAAISIESAELLEVFLWKQEVTSDDLPGVREELADILIFCLSLANRLNLDVSDAVLAKLTANAAKYPAETVKGKSHKYTHYS